MSYKTLEDAMKAAQAHAARPEEKKRLGPMFGWALELLAAEVSRLRSYESEYEVISKDYSALKAENATLRASLAEAREKATRISQSWERQRRRSRDLALLVSDRETVSRTLGVNPEFGYFQVVEEAMAVREHSMLVALGSIKNVQAAFHLEKLSHSTALNELLVKAECALLALLEPSPSPQATPQPEDKFAFTLRVGDENFKKLSPDIQAQVRAVLDNSWDGKPQAAAGKEDFGNCVCGNPVYPGCGNKCQECVI